MSQGFKDALSGNWEDHDGHRAFGRCRGREAHANDGCPMTAALNAIGGKWSLICLYFLDTGTRRFNELRRLMPDVSHKVLTETLRNLEQEGLIVRTVHSMAPSHVEYAISPHGETVRPLMHSICSWGRQHFSWKKHSA